MPTPEHMAATVRAYVDGFAHEDAGAIIDLFAEDAIVEDPVGTPAKSGKEAYSEFFIQTVGSGAKLTLDGPIRLGSDYAAFAFHVDLFWDGVPMRIDVIDVFRFNPTGKIYQMQAFFGDSNFVSADQGTQSNA